jgi:hypothetical protein
LREVNTEYVRHLAMMAPRGSWSILPSGISRGAVGTGKERMDAPTTDLQLIASDYDFLSLAARDLMIDRHRGMDPAKVNNAR